MVWDGVRWWAVAHGTDGAVNALTVLDDALYAAGEMTNGIVKWNGTDWSSAGFLDGTAISLLAANEVLYVGCLCWRECY